MPLIVGSNSKIVSYVLNENKFLFFLASGYTLQAPEAKDEGGEPLLRDHRRFLQVGLILFTIATFLLCPFGSARISYDESAEAGALAQVEFTPDIAPLELTQTAESASLRIVPTSAARPTYGPGQIYAEDDPNRPIPEPSLIEGNQRFGYAQLVENPELYVVWITDENGTHYLVVDKDSQVLTGGSNPDSGFFKIVSNIEDRYSKIQTAVDERDAHNKTARHFIYGEGIVAIAWGGCVILTEGSCLALAPIFFGLFGLGENKANDADTQEAKIEEYRRDIYRYENDLRGLYVIGQAIYGQP